MGWISYLLTQHLHEKRGVPWWWHLLKQAGIPDDSLTELSNSELFDFSPCYQRAGVMMTQCQFKWMASLMYWNHIPFWIEWTLDTSLDRLRTEFHFLQLTPGEVKAACEVNPTLTLPKEPAWKAWLKKQDKLRPIHLTKETPESRKSQLPWEEHVKKYMPFGKGSTAAIYWWDYTVAKDRVWTRLSCGEANHMWGVYANVQRIYNGFTNEWDICTDFGDDLTGLESDKDEILYAEGPIDNEDLMDIGPPSTPSALPLETTDKTPISTELSLAVQFKAASQDPNAIEDLMDIGSPSACSTLQPGTIDWDLKAAESPLIPSAQSLNTASQDLTAIENQQTLRHPQLLLTRTPPPTNRLQWLPNTLHHHQFSISNHCQRELLLHHLLDHLEFLRPKYVSQNGWRKQPLMGPASMSIRSQRKLRGCFPHHCLCPTCQHQFPCWPLHSINGSTCFPLTTVTLLRVLD